MNHKDDDTTSVNLINGPGVVTLDKRLEGIETKIDKLLETHGNTPIRLRAIEIVVYGWCAIVLIAYVSKQFGMTMHAAVSP